MGRGDQNARAPIAAFASKSFKVPFFTRHRLPLTSRTGPTPARGHLIESLIAIDHAIHGEMFLDPLPAARAIQRRDLIHHLKHLLLVRDLRRLKGD